MDAGKRQHLHLLSGSNDFGLLIAARAPPTKLTLTVEEKIAGGFSFLHCGRGGAPIFAVIPYHPPQINGADHVDIVQNERFLHWACVIEEEPSGFFYPAASVEQNILARQFDSHAEVVIPS